MPLALALTVTRLDFALTVPLVFAVAAATFCPLLVLGIWWRGPHRGGRDRRGPRRRRAVGRRGRVSLFAVLPPGWVGVLLYRPALITVPAAFLTMVLVSRLTRSAIPPDVDRALLSLHAPERLGLSQRPVRPP